MDYDYPSEQEDQDEEEMSFARIKEKMLEDEARRNKRREVKQ